MKNMTKQKNLRKNVNQIQNPQRISYKKQEKSYKTGLGSID